MKGDAKRAWLSIALALAVIGSWLLVTRSSVVQAQTTPSPTRPSGRFVALQPPAAGDNTYGNFLWVLDSATGQVTVFRIASVKNESDKHDFWMSERLITEEEYYKLRQQQK